MLHGDQAGQCGIYCGYYPPPTQEEPDAEHHAADPDGQPPHAADPDGQPPFTQEETIAYPMEDGQPPEELFAVMTRPIRDSDLVPPHKRLLGAE